MSQVDLYYLRNCCSSAFIGWRKFEKQFCWKLPDKRSKVKVFCEFQCVETYLICVHKNALSVFEVLWLTGFQFAVLFFKNNKPSFLRFFLFYWIKMFSSERRQFGRARIFLAKTYKILCYISRIFWTLGLDIFSLVRHRDNVRKIRIDVASQLRNFAVFTDCTIVLDIVLFWTLWSFLALIHCLKC